MYRYMYEGAGDAFITRMPLSPLASLWLAISVGSEGGMKVGAPFASFFFLVCSFFRIADIANAVLLCGAGFRYFQGN